MERQEAVLLLGVMARSSFPKRGSSQAPLPKTPREGWSGQEHDRVRPAVTAVPPRSAQRQHWQARFATGQRICSTLRDKERWCQVWYTSQRGSRPTTRQEENHARHHPTPYCHTSELTQLYRPSPQGHQRRHLLTLALMICGVIGARHAQLPQIVSHTPGGRANDASVEKRFRRFLRQEGVTYQRWMLPVAQELLARLSSQPLVLVIDGSTVGRGCIALMVSVLYRKRALPLVWLVIRGSKGHLSDDLHRAVLTQLDGLIPAEAQVVVMGDGEFDGVTFLQALEQRQWKYVCRTASNITVHTTVGSLLVEDLRGKRGESQAVEEVKITAEQYGPVAVTAVWEEAYDKPLYLVTNRSDLDQAVVNYRQRAQIETFFADQKSRGFQVSRSHIEAPE